ncbi:MAG: leucine-rich repeat domain-containing protein [Gemmatimonadota bacterium]|nr:leucine-rich repeat domain-containing protein [Gemmatimonadota bacterium]
MNVRPAGIESLAGIQNLSGLTSLYVRGTYVRGTSITDVSALSGLERLTYLNLNRNSITDISALSGLTRLTKLGLSGNSITDVSALSELTALTELRLSSNPGFSNIEPLLDHREIDSVSLLDTRVSCANVAWLQSNGVFVFSACQ